MFGAEQLVDLSLFSLSPADDSHWALPDQLLYDDETRPPRERRRPLQADFADKPLPPLPPRRLCRGISVPRSEEEGASRILARLRRTVTPPTIIQDNTLLQRRNQTSVPRLTLSVPHSIPRHRRTASAMVWMPEEQMWLIEDDLQPETFPTQTTYPSPPAYSPPRNLPIDRSHSMPTSSIPPFFDLTPPLTPVQTQLQTLIQPPEDERMSPLFQEAMNSVPMTDATDLIQPPLDLSPPHCSRTQRAQTTYESSVRSLSPRAPEGWQLPTRSASMTTGSSRAASDTSDSQSFHSARESIGEDLVEPANSARRWHGLASRIARSSSSASS